MHLLDILEPRWVKVPLLATTKKDVIAELLSVFADDDVLDSFDQALQAVLDREAVRTTGIGSGLALPHGKTDAAKRLVMAVGRTAQPVEFGSVDGKPVDIIVLLLSPKSLTGEHIQALARVSRFLSNDSFRKQIRAAEGSDDVYRLLRQQELAAQASMADH